MARGMPEALADVTATALSAGPNGEYLIR